MKRKRLPTDAEILGAIHDRYRDVFIHDATDRQSKILVPINIEEIARTLGDDPHILFGRLYHDLDGAGSGPKPRAEGHPVLRGIVHADCGPGQGLRQLSDAGRPVLCPARG